jgi:hypothetical protein
LRFCQGGFEATHFGEFSIFYGASMFPKIAGRIEGGRDEDFTRRAAGSKDCRSGVKAYEFTLQGKT